MSKELPLISVLLPTYNGSATIVKAVQSVMQQTFQNWELLILDDGSSDNTKAVVEVLIKTESRITYCKNEHLGIQKTLNAGLQLAKGKYIARIDDDDTWCDNNKLMKQNVFLENNPEYVLVGTGAIAVDENNKELTRYLVPETDHEIRKKILLKNCFVHSSVLFNRKVALGLGGYNETQKIKHIEDYDLWLRLGTIGKFANLTMYGVVSMVRSASLSSQNKLEQMKKSRLLIKKYASHYPNHFFAALSSLARIIVYRLLAGVPMTIIMGRLLKYYKEKW